MDTTQFCHVFIRQHTVFLNQNTFILYLTKFGASVLFEHQQVARSLAKK